MTGPASSSFEPLVSGAHAQTIGGHLVRSFSRWPFPTEDVVVDGEDGVRLLVHASWQPRGEARPTLVLVHGLDSSADAGYVISTGIDAFRAGYHVVRMNMRGCGGSLRICPRLYNAGLTEDLVTVSAWLAERVSRFVMVGFSLGAGLTLLTFARERRRLPAGWVASVAVCPPLDMSRAADALELGGNWIYQFHFTSSLCRSYRQRQRLAPERYQSGREQGVETLRQFDDVVTAYYGGYRDAEHYYQSVSAGPWLEKIDRPTLVLGAGNDPFIPRDTLIHWPQSDDVRVELVEGAGHMGFVSTTRAPRFFWAAERIRAFLDVIDDL